MSFLERCLVNGGIAMPRTIPDTNHVLAYNQNEYYKDHVVSGTEILAVYPYLFKDLERHGIWNGHLPGNDHRN